MAFWSDSTPVLAPLCPRIYSDLSYVDKRLMGVLDSFAALCVSEATGEAYAIALETKANQCTMYVTCNGSPPKSLEVYLQYIKNQILKIGLAVASTGRDKSTEVPLNTTIQTLTFDLLMKCHKHGMKKIRRWLEKRKAGYDTYMEELRRDARSVDAVLHGELCEFQDHLNEVAKIFKTKPSDHVMAMTTMHHAPLFSKYLKEGSSELRLLQASDETFAPVSGGFSMHRFFEKLFTHYTAAMNVISLARSAYFRLLLESDFTVVLVPGEYHVVSFTVRGQDVDDILTPFEETALRRMHSNVEKAAEHCWSGVLGNTFKFRSYVHAECALIAHLHRHTTYAYRYIGVSKPACYSCSRYINAYNAVGEELDSSHEYFWTRGTHGKIDLPWVLPEVGLDRDARIQQKMIEEIKRDMETLLGRDSTRQARSDSTDISASDHSFSAYESPFTYEEFMEQLERNSEQGQ